MILNDVLQEIGNTPIVKVTYRDFNNINLFSKLEYLNPTGSVKDRAAFHIIDKILKNGEITKESTIIESTSGNFGIALSAICKKLGLKFYCIIDPNINPINEEIIRELGAHIIKVTTPDENGGYLLNRIRKVKELLVSIADSYWVNQYANIYNAEAYYTSLGEEICNSMEQIDYVFAGVSSGGTITGISKKVKERFPNSKIIAVDIVGSVIFGGEPKKRFIPGIGSSMVPKILEEAQIDDVVMVDELSTIEACHELLRENTIFAGGSSGSVYCAIKRYFSNKKFSRKPNVITIFADRGDRYSNTIYNNQWCYEFKNKQINRKDFINIL